MAKKILDLFCGGGGCSAGYHRAGFDEITGVDIMFQRRYPFEFVQGDAFEYLYRLTKSGDIYSFDLIHASPICKGNTTLRFIHKKTHPDQITPLREMLRLIGIPYVIENVKGAKLENPLMLCGTMFQLKVIRHRYFEVWPEPIWFSPMACCHDTGGIPQAGYGASPKGFISVAGNFSGVDIARMAMDIDWMGQKELSQAIPPAYTEYIGKILLERIDK